MKTLVKGRVVSIAEIVELTGAASEDSQGVTYEDLVRMFSESDLAEYNELCRNFVGLLGDKSNEEQWNILFDSVVGPRLVGVLNAIEALRRRYNLPGTFHKVWRMKPLRDGEHFEYDEVSWG